MEPIIHWWHLIIAAVETSHPVLLFVSMALLPLVGMPISPLWVAAGIRLGLFGGAAIALAALLINFACGYWLARSWLREPLRRLMEKRGYHIPSLEAGDETRLILLLRVTPGIPLFAQNYLLGLIKVGFTRYLIISLPVQAAYALAFVWFGNSLSDSGLWRIALAVAGLVAVGLLVSLARRKLNCRRAAADNVGP